jgi:hypothetical protein
MGIRVGSLESPKSKKFFLQVGPTQLSFSQALFNLGHYFFFNFFQEHKGCF